MSRLLAPIEFAAMGSRSCTLHVVALREYNGCMAGRSFVVLKHVDAVNRTGLHAEIAAGAFGFDYRVH